MIELPLMDGSRRQTRKVQTRERSAFYKNITLKKKKTSLNVIRSLCRYVCFSRPLFDVIMRHDIFFRLPPPAQHRVVEIKSQILAIRIVFARVSVEECKLSILLFCNSRVNLLLSHCFSHYWMSVE